MSEYKIAVIPGDGIGTEVIAEGEKLLKIIEELDKDISFSLTDYPWGCEYYKKTWTTWLRAAAPCSSRLTR